MLFWTKNPTKMTKSKKLPNKAISPQKPRARTRHPGTIAIGEACHTPKESGGPAQCRAHSGLMPLALHVQGLGSLPSPSGRQKGPGDPKLHTQGPPRVWRRRGPMSCWQEYKVQSWREDSPAS